MARMDANVGFAQRPQSLGASSLRKLNAPKLCGLCANPLRA